jgi:hypothetical protein
VLHVLDGSSIFDAGVLVLLAMWRCRGYAFLASVPGSCASAMKSARAFEAGILCWRSMPWLSCEVPKVLFLRGREKFGTSLALALSVRSAYASCEFTGAMTTWRMAVT